MNSGQARDNNEAVPTFDCFEEPLREYPVGDLANYQEQSKTDPHSLIFVPNCIRSDSKNDCHSGRGEVRLEFNLDIFSTHVLSVKSTPRAPTPVIKRNQKCKPNGKDGCTTKCGIG